MNAIELRNLTKTYPQFTLDNIIFECETRLHYRTHWSEWRWQKHLDQDDARHNPS
ncbi:hypothetical protein J6TS7_17610 [Paenibacillus dendritiformis]|nr:hypothetical protein J6TS7_17610 [Paenibacillus dendritiformis]